MPAVASADCCSAVMGALAGWLFNSFNFCINAARAAACWSAVSEALAAGGGVAVAAGGVAAAGGGVCGAMAGWAGAGAGAFVSCGPPFN